MRPVIKLDSDEHVDHISPVKTPKSTTTPKRTAAKKASSVNKEFSVGSRNVDQRLFENYLAVNIGRVIEIRYQSMRANSANYWRNISLIKYDDTYFYAEQPDRDYAVKYRRDRVVDFR